MPCLSPRAARVQKFHVDGQSGTGANPPHHRLRQPQTTTTALAARMPAAVSLPQRYGCCAQPITRAHDALPCCAQLLKGMSWDEIFGTIYGTTEISMRAKGEC